MLFTGKSKEEMVEFLRKDPSGRVNVDAFDQESVKTLDELFQEYRDRQLALSIDKGRVWRQADSVKIMVTACHGRYVYKEKYRIYRNPRGFRSYRRVVKHKQAAASETRIKGETSFAAVQRCFKEEWGKIKVDPSLIKVAHADDKEMMSGRVECYESTAYKGIMTFATVDWFQVDFPELPWPDEEKMFADGNVWLCVGRTDTLSAFASYLQKLDKAS